MISRSHEFGSYGISFSQSTRLASIVLHFQRSFNPRVDRLYQSNKLPHSILVFPDGNDNRGSNPIYDPDYLDGLNGKAGTLIGQEMVQQIKTQYRTLSEPQFWAIGGVSSGWGAYNIGLRHLDRFNIFFSHSGYFTDNSSAANSPNEFIQKLGSSLSRWVFSDSASISSSIPLRCGRVDIFLRQLPDLCCLPCR